jgi:hypothetical protein
MSHSVHGDQCIIPQLLLPVCCVPSGGLAGLFLIGYRFSVRSIWTGPCGLSHLWEVVTTFQITSQKSDITSCPFSFSLPYRSHNILWRKQILKFLVLKFAPALRLFLCLSYSEASFIVHAEMGDSAWTMCLPIRADTILLYIYYLLIRNLVVT